MPCSGCLALHGVNPNKKNYKSFIMLRSSSRTEKYSQDALYDLLHSSVSKVGAAETLEIYVDFNGQVGNWQIIMKIYMVVMAMV